MKIIIAGGGIGGLTSALAAKKNGCLPILYEKNERIDIPSFGGGIGLWPTSQAVMERLGILEELKKVGYYMPSASYFNQDGHVLGRPSINFGRRFPVLCLQRRQLTEILLKNCQRQNIAIHSSTSIISFGQSSKPDMLKVYSENNLIGQTQQCNILIAADGINSNLRPQIMQERNLPSKRSHHCGYAYFRAVVDIGSYNQGSEWFKHSFESWGQRKRFGFVPLKFPKVFWFVAIPIGEQGLEEHQGSHVCDDERKKWIIKQFETWKAPINIKYLMEATPQATILRTDIRKIDGVTIFPWTSRNKRVVLLGDSAHATAPNLAQGAGLAIESSWDFFSSINPLNLSGIDKYIKKRQRRAYTVQSMADMVAKIGQLSRPSSQIRDSLMSNATKYFPSLEQRIFESTLSYSLGGNSNSLYWSPINTSQKSQKQTNFLQKIIGHQNFNKLPQKTKEFRSQLIGQGTGDVTVETISWLARIFSLPQNMKQSLFTATVETEIMANGEQKQKWTRVFGASTLNASKFTTYHHSSVDLSTRAESGYSLTQTLGFGPDFLRFGYNVKVEEHQVSYMSNGLWLRNMHLPIPRILCPTSQWTEKKTSEGWHFSGEINFPKLIASLSNKTQISIMKYYGDFKCQNFCPGLKKKKVVIAGGSGMVGYVTSKIFYQNGWDVAILTRDKNKNQRVMPFCSFIQWKQASTFAEDKDIENLSRSIEDADVVINLAGDNPGSWPWTPSKKDKILTSRLTAIDRLNQALKIVEKKTNKIPVFIQASAAGIYGNRNDQVLTESSQSSKQNTFRVRSCQQIQRYTLETNPKAIIARIGHVLSSRGGLFPHLKLASLFSVKNIGTRANYIPWVHIEDVGNSLLFLAETSKGNPQHIIANIASPQHATYTDILHELTLMRGRKKGHWQLPDGVMKGVMREMASVVLESQRMQPEFLIKQGYTFRHERLTEALSSQECL